MPKSEYQMQMTKMFGLLEFGIDLTFGFWNLDLGSGSVLVVIQLFNMAV
jgi:hypothetical protein